MLQRKHENYNLSEGNPTVSNEFPLQMITDAERASMSWCFGLLSWSPPYYRIYITIIVIITIIITSAEWRIGYVFTIVSFFVCLSVCLPVSNITEKRLNWFSWDFQGMRDLV